MAVKKDENTKKWYFYGKYYDPFMQKNKQYKRRGFNTKTEAKNAEAKFLLSLNDEVIGNIPMNKIIEEYYKYKEPEMKKSSYQSLKNKTDKHILPYFKDMGILDIKARDIKNWKEHMNTKGLSLKYRKDIFDMLSSIFKFSNRIYGINNNSCLAEGNFKDPMNQVKEMEFWTLEEFIKFDSVIDDHEYRTFFNFLYWTGCRKGEVQALNWNDFTEGFKSVKIRKTINMKITGQTYEITPPKTACSNRDIPLPKQLISLLQEHYNNMSIFDGFSSNCFVFGFNTPLSNTTIERKKNEWCKIAEVKQIRLHDFRHSHASFLISNSPNDKNLILAISKRLGHSSPNTTLRVYAHMMPDDNDKILDMLNI